MAAAPPIRDLTDRARDMFRLGVDGNLAIAAPVGSKTLAQG